MKHSNTFCCQKQRQQEISAKNQQECVTNLRNLCLGASVHQLHSNSLYTNGIMLLNYLNERCHFYMDWDSEEGKSIINTRETTHTQRNIIKGKVINPAWVFACNWQRGYNKQGF